MNLEIRPDLVEIINSGANGRIDMDHFERWQRFKRLWSKEDKAKWQALLSRMHKKSNVTWELVPHLSYEEKMWAKDLIEKAEAMNLC